MKDMGIIIYASILALIFTFLPFLFTGCIPKVPDQVVEEVRACYIPEPIPKSKLPTVKYIIVDEYKCFADAEQEENAKKREASLKKDGNNIRDQYNDVRKRCSENKGE